jgi:glutamine synthetase
MIQSTSLNPATIAALVAAGVQYILPQFTDIHGVAKGKLIPIAQWKNLLNPGAGFAGPSIWGTGLGRHGDDSEYYARADPATPVQQLPWLPSVARVVCDGYAGGKPLATCSRQTLKRQVERLAALGYGLNVGIEPEFFITQPGSMALNDAQDTLEKPSYDLNALFKQPVYGLIQALHQSLTALDFDVVQIDHEDAPGQYEINYTYEQALGAADRFMLFKLAAHGVAQNHGQAISFMPKPFADRPGSGLHFHLSLTDATGKLLTAPKSKNPLLTQTMMHALGGMLAHAPALCALHAPTVNSYKRLVIGRSQSGTTWAPAHIAYGYNNRSCVARSLQGRFEWRLPDPSANVYLAIAGVIAAMVDGIENKINPPASVDEDLYEKTHADIVAAGIHTLPQNLGDALAALTADASLQGALGAAVSAQFLELKQAEWIDYARHVSDWEVKQYAQAF